MNIAEPAQRNAAQGHVPAANSGASQAAQAAAALAAAQAAGGPQQVTLKCGSASCSVAAASVRQVIELGQLTPMPLLPTFIAGVVILRGNVVPVIDLAALLGGTQGTVVQRRCAVIVGMPHEGKVFDMALLVDGLSHDQAGP